jgi:rsbT co-antagonist protein RsbR
MAEMAQLLPEQNLMRDMAIGDKTIERRLRVVGLGPEDITLITSLRPIVNQHLDEYSAVFFNYLNGLDEARGLFGNRELLEKARRNKAEHLQGMVQGNYGREYVEGRLRAGLLYSRAELDTAAFMAAFHQLLAAMGLTVMRHFERAPLEGFQKLMALKKVATFDLTLIVDTLVFERERVIRQQQEAIRELSTPVLQIRDRMLLLPIIGVIDTDRARLVTESLLRAIRLNRAKVVVMDVTGVATVDSKVANHLLQTVAAARLMGALVIVTGLSADVAQSLVALGIDVAKLNTVGDLQGGVEDAERLLGFQVVQSTDGVARTFS